MGFDEYDLEGVTLSMELLSEYNKQQDKDSKSKTGRSGTKSQLASGRGKNIPTKRK